MRTAFPFGFIERSVFIPLRSEMVVFPRLGEVRLQFPAGRPAFGLSGARRPFLRALEEEFHGLRDFREGDSPRDIHWRSSAKWL